MWSPGHLSLRAGVALGWGQEVRPAQPGQLLLGRAAGGRWCRTSSIDSRIKAAQKHVAAGRGSAGSRSRMWGTSGCTDWCPRLASHHTMGDLQWNRPQHGGGCQEQDSQDEDGYPSLRSFAHLVFHEVKVTPQDEEEMVKNWCNITCNATSLTSMNLPGRSWDQSPWRSYRVSGQSGGHSSVRLRKIQGWKLLNEWSNAKLTPVLNSLKFKVCYVNICTNFGWAQTSEVYHSGQYITGQMISVYRYF